MEGLLHWDFTPGIALAEHVRRRFGSTVHFLPSRDIKEFFLVVSFSSASFALSEESVAIALQCCIGGISSGFKVCRLNKRSFRFSVANNKVGHFIYGLRDRIWPDFICHFHLFNGRFAKLASFDSSWHADEVLQELSACHPVAVQSSLKFPTSNDHACRNIYSELNKFDIRPINSIRFSLTRIMLKPHHPSRR